MIDGFSFPNLTKRIDIAGRHVSQYLVELLQRRGYNFNRSADLETVRRLKEQACFVALNYSQELKVPFSKHLPTFVSKCFTPVTGHSG